MDVAVIISADPAGKNVLRHLLQKYPLVEEKTQWKGKPVYRWQNLAVYTSPLRCIYNEHIDREIAADLFVFATTHRSEKGTPTLSCHAPGNWGKAEFGGEDKVLCRTSACYLKAFLLMLQQKNTLGWDVVQEVTHHGPALEKPAMFVEIGSTAAEWKNAEAGRIMAACIVDAFTKPAPSCKAAVGIGGLHTTPNLRKAVERTGYAIGHACPKYWLERLDQEMLQQAITKTVEKVELIILDWKGLKGEKERIVSLLEEMGLQWEKSEKMY
ncbi:D-tyrosyl-tRNA(Tyr) deacylase [Candidatus Woesearchaeota archaeon]|nr:D-tyrosyl-tRNA(Tyr) deacylase [Candidatus Woesearchaeota archaeon]